MKFTRRSGSTTVLTATSTSRDCDNKHHPELIHPVHNYYPVGNIAQRDANCDHWWQYSGGIRANKVKFYDITFIMNSKIDQVVYNKDYTKSHIIKKLEHFKYNIHSSLEDFMSCKSNNLRVFISKQNDIFCEPKSLKEEREEIEEIERWKMERENDNIYDYRSSLEYLMFGPSNNLKNEKPLASEMKCNPRRAAKHALNRSVKQYNRKI